MSWTSALSHTLLSGKHSQSSVHIEAGAHVALKKSQSFLKFVARVNLRLHTIGRIRCLLYLPGHEDLPSRIHRVASASSEPVRL